MTALVITARSGLAGGARSARALGPGRPAVLALLALPIAAGGEVRALTLASLADAYSAVPAILVAYGWLLLVE